MPQIFSSSVLIKGISTGARLRRLSLFFSLIAIAFLFVADIHLYTPDPWQELSRIGWGLVTPYWPNASELGVSLLYTVSFALLAVSGAAIIGMLLAMWYHWRVVRVLAAAVRSVHEIFWGLMFMQIFGLSATTGLLAILIPFTGIFAKVFSEIFEQQPVTATSTFGKASRLSRFVYGWIPQAWPALASYTRYRFECALRSSAILGFIGLPTLGFHLETAFKQGDYSEAAAVLWLFLLLIASVRFWLKLRLLPVYLLLAVLALPEMPPVNASFIWQFFSQDIWPTALQDGDFNGTWEWISRVGVNEVWPALWQTIAITQAALVLSGVLALVLYPLASRALVGRWSVLGRFKLLVLRSVPELMLAYVFMLLFGPSALPAILALALHNGGLIAFLLANSSEDANKRIGEDVPKGMMRFAYVDLPQRYPAFLAFLFYRWEVILRESAMMGVVGIATLGFYVDSAFEEIRFDKAFFLIVVAALLNICVDGLSRWLRARSGLKAPTL